MPEVSRRSTSPSPSVVTAGATLPGDTRTADAAAAEAAALPPEESSRVGDDGAESDALGRSDGDEYGELRADGGSSSASTLVAIRSWRDSSKSLRCTICDHQQRDTRTPQLWTVVTAKQQFRSARVPALAPGTTARSAASG
jgi:hypothetical protein